MLAWLVRGEEIVKSILCQRREKAKDEVRVIERLGY